MYTREQYLDGDCNHQEYYGQFVTKQVMEFVVRQIGIDRVVNSKSYSFSDIDLKEWDKLYMQVVHLVGQTKMKQVGDSWSIGGAVCIAKQAARMYKEQVEKFIQEDYIV